jgi:hypothetical protein
MKVTVCACVLLAVSARMMPASSAQQTSIMAKNAAFRPAYDASKEVTISGTVHSISAHSDSGKPFGAHLMIATAHGLVDAHLGSFALQGSRAVSLNLGEQVRVAGVMTTVKGSPMLLARTIQTSNKTFVIRNEHGALLFPRPAARGQIRFKKIIPGSEQQ